MPPLTLLIKPASSLCNMRCRYCFYADEGRHREKASCGIMSEETLEKLIQRAFTYADTSVTFAFQGGEPTLAGLDFYRTLLRLEAQYNTKAIPVRHSIQTNGCLLDEAWAAFLAEHHFLVGLSIDGCRETHDENRPDADGRGTFDRISRAAKLLQKHKVDFNVLCVVTDAVARHPLKVYGALKQYRFLQFIPCLDPLDAPDGHKFLSEEAYSAFLRQVFDLYYRDFRKGQYVSIRQFDNYVRMLNGAPPESCGMAGCCAVCPVIEADGSVYPCDFYALDEWRLGSLHDAGFEELLTCETAKQFVRQSLHVSEACRRCPYARLCRGGCRRDREPFADGLPRLNRYCGAYRAFFAHCLPMLADMAKRTIQS